MPNQSSLWFIGHKPSYDADFVKLPRKLQPRASQVHALLEIQPNHPQGDTILPLKGWDNLWRYRLGDYRLIYSVAPERRVVLLLAIGPRKDVYKRFSYEPDADDQLSTLTFGPELAAALRPRRSKLPEWQSHPEWLHEGKRSDDDRRLPEKLTPGCLRRWLVPDQYDDELMRCLTEEDLVKAAVPPDVLGKVMEALWPSNVIQIASQPDLVLLNPGDLERYAEGTLRGFLLKLDDDQHRYTEWALAGPTLVKGGPGSGKSTVALYRVRALVERAITHDEPLPRILFTTYTNALIRYSQSLLRHLLADLLDLSVGDELPAAITVTTVDQIAMQIVTRSNNRKPGMADTPTQKQAIEQARTQLREEASSGPAAERLSSILEQVGGDYLVDEFDWVIEGQNCRTIEEYLAAQRIGRRIPFHRSVRQATWELYSLYCEKLKDWRVKTWGKLRQEALEVVQQHHDLKWDYVVVDEAQDLSPAALAFCLELCRKPQGLFLTADANQSIYSRGFRWKNVHEELQVTGRTRELRRNYRSTREIAIAASDFLALESDIDSESFVQEYVHGGAYPVIYSADGAEDQVLWLGQQIIDAAKELRLPIHGAAVLVPSRALGERVAQLLTDIGLPARFVESRNMNLAEHRIKVLTLHSAKGLEFPIVGLAHIEIDRLPRVYEFRDELEQTEYWESERRLLYVGCTRAMRYLFLTYDRGQPSPFLQDISDDHWMREAEDKH